MKYEEPTYEIATVETEDVLTPSFAFEISKTDAGEGKIKMNFSDLIDNA